MTWLVAGTLSLLLAGVAYKIRLLSLDGAVVAFSIGFLLYGIGEFPFSFSVLYFFFTANLLGKFKRNRLGITSKHESRNSLQVLANGFLPILFVCLWGIFSEPVFVLFFLTAICTATADTWATELGALSKKYPRSILTFKKVEPGVSGGITSLGTVAACLGAFSNSYFSAYFFSNHFNINLSLPNILVIAFLAVLAQFVDSLLGACCQVRYVCATCRRVVEERLHCHKPTLAKSGFRWLTNDMVNFLSILAGIFILWMCLKIFYL